MQNLPLILTVSPDRLREVRVKGCTIAHMAYRMGRGPHLYRAGGSQPLNGGLMGLDVQQFDGSGQVAPFCQEVMRECASRNFRGVICDFEGRKLPVLEQIVQELGESFHRKGWSFYVAEGYGHCSPHAKVMISSAISGGSLEVRLQEAAERYGAERTILAVERLAEDFFLPAPNGNGTPLSQQELTGHLERLTPSVFFSRELCARYFTYMSRDTGAHFVLFDDGGTIHQKLELAARLNLGGAVLAWAEICEWKAELGLGG